MKKIKSLLLIGLLALCIGNVTAQMDRTHWGVKMGMDISDMGGDLKSTKVKMGYQFGLTFDYQIVQNLYLQSGLDFTNKGFKKNHMLMPLNAANDSKFSMNALYLQVPVYAAYKINIGQASRLVFNAGPYVAYGVGGKMKHTRNVDGWKQIEQRSSFGYYGLKRIDLGLGFGVGVELSGLILQFNYELGLRDLNKGRNEQLLGKMKNRNAVISIGFKM